MGSKSSRSDHYRAIAAFYGRALVEDMRNASVPEFVLVQAARRTARFALTAIRLGERQAGGGWAREQESIPGFSGEKSAR